MVQGGVSIRRSTDPATDGLTDDRIRHGGDDGRRKDADPARRDGPRYLTWGYLPKTVSIPASTKSR
jgi:hypothetical protein